MGQPVKIDLLGASFTIQTDQDVDYVRSLVRYVEEKARELGGTRSKDTTRTAILVSILLADELFQARTGTAPIDSDAESIALRLIDQIDTVLDDEENRR